MKESSIYDVNDSQDDSDDNTLMKISDSEEDKEADFSFVQEINISNKKKDFINNQSKNKSEYSIDLLENIKRYKHAKKNFVAFIKSNHYLKNANEYEINLARLDMLNLEIHLLLLARCAYIYHRDWLNLNWPKEKRELLLSEKANKPIPGYLYLVTQAYLLQIYRDKLDIRQIKEDSFSLLLKKITPNINKVLTVFLEKELGKDTFFTPYSNSQDIQSSTKNFTKIVAKLISKFENVSTSQLISMSLQFISLKTDLDKIKKEIENEFGDLNQLRKEDSVYKVDSFILEKTLLVSEITHCLEEKSHEYIDESTDKFKNEISSIGSDFQSLFYEYFKDDKDKSNIPFEYTVKMDTNEILSSFGFKISDNLLSIKDNDQNVENKMLSIGYNTNNNNNEIFENNVQNEEISENIISFDKPIERKNNSDKINKNNKDFKYVPYDELKSRKSSGNETKQEPEKKGDCVLN